MEESDLREFIEIIDALLVINIDTDLFYGTYDGEYFKVSEFRGEVKQVSRREVINFYKQKERQGMLSTWEKEACLACHLMD